jgi:hypothetical protein
VILDEHASKDVVARFGLARPAFALVRGGGPPRAEAARAPGVPFPAVLKALGVAHKTERGAVVIGIRGPEELAAAAEGMASRFPGYDLLVEEQVPHTVELALGLRRDPVFGPVVMFGSGGVLVELQRDVAFALAPVSEAEARRLVASTKVGRAFSGFRNLRYDAGAAVRALRGLSRLAEEGVGGRAVAELDVNPAVYRGGGLVALDARVVVE